MLFFWAFFSSNIDHSFHKHMKQHNSFQRNKLHFKIYSNRKQLFEIVILFLNITVFTAALVSVRNLNVMFYCIFAALSQTSQ